MQVAERITTQTVAVAMLIVTGVCFSLCSAVSAQTPTMQYQQLPADLRNYADKIHRNCKEQDDSSQPSDLMQGIQVVDLDGNGSRDLLVDAEQLCNGWIKAGNCSNRGCDLKIWKQTGQRSWRVMFDEHVSRKFISTNDKHGVSLMAVSIYAGSPQCEPQQGKQYTSGESCDALVRYQNKKFVWEKIK